MLWAGSIDNFFLHLNPIITCTTDKRSEITFQMKVNLNTFYPGMYNFIRINVNIPGFGLRYFFM